MVPHGIHGTHRIPAGCYLSHARRLAQKYAELILCVSVCNDFSRKGAKCRKGLREVISHGRHGTTQNINHVLARIFS